MSTRTARYSAVTAPRRFHNKVTVSDTCWLWTGGISKGGYGYFDGTYAHRWSYEHYKGPVPDGCEIDHLCRVRHCVNPDHLEAVAHAENMRRTAGIKHGPYDVGSHCRHGHERTPENTRIRASDGARECLPCRRLSVSRCSARKATAAHA